MNQSDALWKNDVWRAVRKTEAARVKMNDSKTLCFIMKMIETKCLSITASNSKERND